MEVLSGRSAVANLHIIFGAELQEAFNAGAGVLRPLALETVRQQQNKSAGLIPFRFRRAQELINNDLRAIDEIAELGFPKNESQRVGHAIAELKTHHRIFTEQAVNGLKLDLVWLQVLESHVAIAALVIVELEMALSKRSAAHVFAA